MDLKTKGVLSEISRGSSGGEEGVKNQDNTNGERHKGF